MPLLTKITTEEEKQIGITEDDKKVLLFNPSPGFNSQETSKGKPHIYLVDNLKEQARKDKNYYYQQGICGGALGSEIISYIRWDGEIIK